MTGLPIGEVLGLTWADDGLDVVFVSRQLGHADPGVTLSVYAHVFAQAKHALVARSALEARYATMAVGRS